MQDPIFALHAEIEDRHWWFRARRTILAELVRALVPPGGLVLDAGCGTGGVLAALAATHRCIGIDPSPEAIRLARERRPGIEFRCGHAPEGLADAIGRADLLMLLDVLEHVEHEDALLARVVQALRPGAWVLLTVPADMRLWSQTDVNYGHFRRYDRAGLERLWSALPVETRMLSHFNARLYPAVRAVRWLNRLRGASSGRAGTDLALPPAPVNRALERLFEGERRVLGALLLGRRRHGYARGVSLVAVLRRGADAPPSG